MRGIAHEETYVKFTLKETSKPIKSLTNRTTTFIHLTDINLKLKKYKDRKRTDNDLNRMNGVGDNKTLQSKTAQQGLKGRSK